LWNARRRLRPTKLRRFSAGDRADIRLLCDLGRIDAARLENILEKAFIWNMEKDGDEYRDKVFRNLRVVQNYLGGESSEL
jgi:hypothetical protein